MNRQEFAEFMQEHPIVILDGATGSNLQKMGMPAGICVEKWICEHEEPLIELQKAYIEAGSRIVYASTFGANRIKLKEYGLDQEVAAINKQAVAVSKKAAGKRALVAGDVTMTGQQLEPLGTIRLEELIDAYKEQIHALEEGGADLIVVETMMSLQETRAALIAAREVSDLPVIATMSFGEDGRTLYGTDAGTAAVVLEGLGAAAVGVNCSAGPDKMAGVIRDMRKVVQIPIIAKPNAGLPKLGTDGATEYDMDVDEFVRHMHRLVQEGASILGGCCGTDPAYISGVRMMLEQDAPVVKAVPEGGRQYLTSERKTIVWSGECRIGTIGTAEYGELNEEWEEDIYDTLYDAIDECMDDEADVLMLCVDGCSENREEIIRRVIQETTGYTSLPLIFQSEYPEVLETALRTYPGRTCVRTTESVRSRAQEIAGRYGAFVL